MNQFIVNVQESLSCITPPHFFPFYNHFQYTMARGTTVFLIFAIIWQMAVGALYGFFFSYNESAFVQMDNVSSVFNYNYTLDAKTVFRTNTSQYPYPQAVVALAMILIVVGLALIAGYIERSSVTGVALTLLIFAMTVQNFFIFRGLLNRIGLNGNSSTGFLPFNYPQINYINFGNDLQSTKDTYALPSASFLDAVGASLAIYAGYTAVVGRISFGEVFFLSWFGTLFYEINSQILWRAFIPDNGYPSRAFAYGGALGLISSLIISKRKQTKNHAAFKSSSRTMAVAFLGTILVWCSYPILVLSSVFTSTAGKVVSMAGQVNIWLALAAGVVGCYAASSLSYRRFCLHDLIFTSLTGGIAFSSSTDINYNPGAATAIGFSVGLLMSLLHTNLKRKINSGGVIDSNSVIFHFLLPSFIASISSAILQGVGNSAASYTLTSISSSNITSINTVSYSQMLAPGRSVSIQGGFQIIGWVISVAFGAAAGGLIGIIYRSSNDNFKEVDKLFNDATLYDFPVINVKDSVIGPAPSVIQPQINQAEQQEVIQQGEERVQPLPEIVPQQEMAQNEQHQANIQEKEGQEMEQQGDIVVEVQSDNPAQSLPVLNLPLNSPVDPVNS